MSKLQPAKVGAVLRCTWSSTVCVYVFCCVSQIRTVYTSAVCVYNHCFHQQLLLDPEVTLHGFQ